MELGANKMHAKFNMVVNKPLVTGPEEQKILGNLFPEHCVFTFIVGKLVKELKWKILDSAKQGINFRAKWMAVPVVRKSI